MIDETTNAMGIASKDIRKLSMLNLIRIRSTALIYLILRQCIETFASGSRRHMAEAQPNGLLGKIFEAHLQLSSGNQLLHAGRKGMMLLVAWRAIPMSRDCNPRNGNNGYRDANFPRQLCGRLRKLKVVGMANGPGVLG
ncbi:hypothetical protein MKX08_003555 [Trichoderma sp. CBMAI-0020]|nr:hypothetical protein MKX08_003555 [Trichoderma sp. CBMAI-0020]